MFVANFVNMKRVILITGGCRSGKSDYAEKMALSLAPNPVYVATARIWDQDFALRVERHKARRGPQWTNVEEEKNLGRLNFPGRVVLVDCLTLWATNYFFDSNSDPDTCLAAMKREMDQLLTHDATYIFVTNEIGLGGISDNELQRRFTDLQGSVNQYVAERADEVILMVSGIPVKIK